MENNKIAFIITAFNEEKTIEKVIKNCEKFGEVFAVDDCSTDTTYELLKKLKVFCLKNNKNLGYENSLFKCLNHVYTNFKHDYYITIDADNQFDFNSINLAINQIQPNKLLISSVRITKNRIIESIIDKIFFYIFNLNDPLSGLKIYNRDLLNLMPNLNKIKGLLGMNYILFCLINKIKIYQFSVEPKPRVGKSTFGGFFKSNYYIFISFLKFFYIYLLFKVKKN